MRSQILSWKLTLSFPRSFFFHFSISKSQILLRNFLMASRLNYFNHLFNCKVPLVLSILKIIYVSYKVIIDNVPWFLSRSLLVSLKLLECFCICTCFSENKKKTKISNGEANFDKKLGLKKSCNLICGLFLRPILLNIFIKRSCIFFSFCSGKIIIKFEKNTNENLKRKFPLQNREK